MRQHWLLHKPDNLTAVCELSRSEDNKSNFTMQKQRRIGFYLDYMHKGFVCTCIAVTLYGFSQVFYRTFTYYTIVRPQIQKLKDAENKKLLAEGASEDFNGTSSTIKM